MAATPVLPTTAAIAPNAPIGASHMIIARMRNTSACICRIAPRIGSPFGAHLLQREADEQRDEQHLQDVAVDERRRSVVGMMPRMNSCVVFASVVPAS